jgi:hypothetical protein
MIPPKTRVQKPIEATFLPPRRSPRALSHSGPSKEIHQRSLNTPSRPQTGLPSRPSQNESHRLSSLSFPPLASRLSPARSLCLISLKQALSLLGRTREREMPGKSFRRGYPIEPGCPLGLRLCLIRMLCHPKSPAAHPDQACNQPDIDTIRQTLGLAEAPVQAPICAS